MSGPAHPPAPRLAVITVSDSRAGGGVDASGDLVVARFATVNARLASRLVVPDEAEAIRSALASVLGEAEVVVLSGGSGLGPRDRTPQAVIPLLDYEVPGMAEAMRQEGLRHTPHAMLSRQVVGVARGVLVMVLPGSPRAVGECLDAVWPAMAHALALLRGETRHDGPPPPA